MKIIDSEKDLEKLTIDDILSLRQEECFKDFAKEYNKVSEKNYFDNYFENKRMHIKVILYIKTILVAVFFTIISTIITSILALPLKLNILVSILVLAITSILTYLFQVYRKSELPIVEKYLCKIIGFFDPVSLYLAKLKWKLRKR